MGPHVVRQLARRGHEVTIFHRGETEIVLPSSVHHVHGDFSRFADYIDTLHALSPEVVLDMVPFRKEDAARVKAFKGVARRVVAISSQDVYRAFGRLCRTEPGPPDPVPLKEDSPLREKLSTAGLDYNKTAIESAIMGDADLPATVVRLPATHGPGDYQHRFFEYIRRMDDKRPAILLDEAYADWQWARGYVEDVAHAIVLAATNDRATGRVYNVAYEKAFTGAEWVRQIARVIGWKGSIIALPSGQLPEQLRNEALGLSQQYTVDSSRIRSELGYAEVVPFDDALLRTIEWERANPPDKVNTNDFSYDPEDAVLAKLKP